MCRPVAKPCRIAGFHPEANGHTIGNTRTRAERREARLRWVAREADRERQEAAEEAKRQHRAHVQELLSFLPEGATSVKVDFAYEAHVSAATTVLQPLATMQRPATVEKLASLLFRRRCCNVRVGVPCHEVAAMMLPLLEQFPEADALRRMITPCAAISSASDMGLATSAAARALSQMVVQRLDFAHPVEFLEWLSLQNWVSVVVKPDVLVQTLSERGIIRVSKPAGRIEYGDGEIISVPSNSVVLPRDVDVHHVSVHLGPGKVSGVCAKLLRMDGLENLASRWKKHALSFGNVFVKALEPAIEFSNGLTLKLKVHLLGTPDAVSSFLMQLKAYVQTDITKHWTPPSFICARIRSQDVGRIVGKLGSKIRSLEWLHNVCLHVEKQQGDECVVKGWALPRLYLDNESSLIIQKLQDAAASKCKEVEVCIGRILAETSPSAEMARKRRQAAAARRFMRLQDAQAVENDSLVQNDMDTKIRLDADRVKVILREQRRLQQLSFKLRRQSIAKVQRRRIPTSKRKGRAQNRLSVDQVISDLQ
jgi:hypothetical protein